MNRPRAARWPYSIYALVLAAGTAITTAHAQVQAPPAASSPQQLTGNNFAGVRFRQIAVPGKLRLGATNVWSWDDGPTQRLVLDGDVDAVIAGYTFHAKRAAAWLEPVTVDAKPATQVFIYFEELGSAADPAGGVTMASDHLPVRAVLALDGPVELAADLHLQGPPAAGQQAALMRDSQAALLKTLRRETGQPEPVAAATPLPYLSRKSTIVRAPRQPLLAPGAVVMTPLPQATRTEPGQPPSEPTRTANVAPPTPPVPPRTQPPRAEPPRGTPPETTTPPTRTATGPQTPSTSPTTPTPTPPTASTPGDIATPATPPTDAVPAAPAPEATGDLAPIFAKDGIVTIFPGEASIVSGEDEGSIIATGGVTVQYEETRSRRVLTMTAQRAVVFFNGGRLADAARAGGGFSMGSGLIHGVFLEGNVMATDGGFTMHAPEIYYDFRANRAVALDAVFWTYDQQRRLPLYVRAKAVYQESARQFVAKDARFTNTPFFDPELAIGASTVTITRVEDAPARPRGPRVADTGLSPTSSEQGSAASPETLMLNGAPVLGSAPAGAAAAGGNPLDGGNGTTIVNARNITLQLLGIPVFYWPRYSGDPAAFPLRDFRIESRSGSGTAVRATFNAYSLLGLKHPQNLTADLITDFYFQRGAGLGGRFAWAEADHQGSIFGYMLPSDRGTDLTSPGARIEHNGDFRGLIAAEDRWKINDHWTLFAEAESISDPTFVHQFFQPQEENHREFTDRVVLRRLDENTYFSLQAKGTTDDFISNQYLLESQGYAVSKLPEAFYSRQADDLLGEAAPGVLTYTSEYRAGRVGMDFDEVLASERGFTNNTAAQRAFGINFNQSLEQALRGRGLFEDSVNRADTRHELSLQQDLGPVHVQPFVVGRATFWDDDFEALSPDNDDNVRLWSAAGIRTSTTIQHVYDNVESRLFDIHRIRHIIEPNATVWIAGTSVEAADLPVYDYDVEPLNDGHMLRAGVTQTFQTQRGAPGQWHSVDLLTVSTDFVYSSDDTPRKSPIPRFFDFRPELSSAGKFGVIDATLRLTDAASLAGGTIYDFDAQQQATSNIGLLLRHQPGFVTLLDLRYLNPQDSTYLTYVTSYDVTDKYGVALGLTYDATNGGVQSLVAEVRRRFSSMMLGLSVSHNEISGENSFGFLFQPYGATGGARFSGTGTGGIAGVNGNNGAAWK